jgi:hypothetical protein
MLKPPHGHEGGSANPLIWAKGVAMVFPKILVLFFKKKIKFLFLLRVFLSLRY